MEDIKVKKRGRPPKNSGAFITINEIPVGEWLILYRDAWFLRTPPGAHLLRKRLNREFKVETLADDSGWKITALS